MTDPTYTHVFFLLDRSGSMQSIKSDTEGGFAAYIEELAKGDGTCRVSLAQFDTSYDHVFHDIDVRAVRPISLEPRGGTALLDAIGRMVHEAGSFLAGKPEEQRPGTVIVGIMTDGMENSSQEWTYDAVRRLIEQQEGQYSWTFMYMGADQDAIEVGARMGIAADRSITYNRGNVRRSMGVMGASAQRYRQAKAQGMPEHVAKQQAMFSEDERRAAVERGEL